MAGAAATVVSHLQNVAVQFTIGPAFDHFKLGGFFRIPCEQKGAFVIIQTQNDAVIVESRKLIKSLEEQNKGYYDVINSLQANASVAEKDVRDVVAVLIGKKVF